MDESYAKRRLRIRLHDVSPLTWDACAEWIDLCRLLALPPPDLLVVPRHEGGPAQRGIGLPRDFVRRLKELSGQGHALWIHGWTHRSERGREAEFAGLDAVHAADRIRRALRDWRDAGLPEPVGFCPPCWTIPREAVPMALRMGFPRVDLRWGDATPEGLEFAPVLSSWGGTGRVAACWDSWLPLQRRVLGTVLPLLRVALHPQDLDTQARLPLQRILHALA